MSLSGLWSRRLITVMMYDAMTLYYKALLHSTAGPRGRTGDINSLESTVI